MGEQCIVVRGIPGSKPRGEPPFFDPSLSEEIRLEMKKGARELGLKKKKKKT